MPTTLTIILISIAALWFLGIQAYHCGERDGYSTQYSFYEFKLSQGEVEEYQQLNQRRGGIFNPFMCK